MSKNKKLNTEQDHFETEPGAVDDPGIKRLKKRSKSLKKTIDNIFKEEDRSNKGQEYFDGIEGM